MNLFKEMIEYRATKGLELIGEYHALTETRSLQETALLVKESVAELKKYQRVWQALKHPYIQRAAARAQLSLPVVVVLGTKANFRLRYHKNRVGLLVQLCELVQGLGVDEATALITETITAWLEDATRQLDVAYMHKRVGKDGKRRLTAAFSAPLAARIDTILHRLAEKIRQDEPQLQYDQAYAKALAHKLTSTDAGGGQQELFGPMFMIATDCHFHADGKISTTDGALVDIRDVVDEKIAATGWAAVTGTSDDSPVIPLVGAFVKVHRRLASPPQRLAAILETLVCAWPGCDVAGTKCQIHHITAYQHGGLTTGLNLTALCKQHNGENDDNPHQNCNGRIERDPHTGRPGFRRYPEQPLIFNNEPVAAKSITALKPKP